MKENHENDEADLMFEGYSFHNNVSRNLLLIHPSVMVTPEIWKHSLIFTCSIWTIVPSISN